LDFLKSRLNFQQWLLLFEKELVVAVSRWFAFSPIFRDEANRLFILGRLLGLYDDVWHQAVQLLARHVNVHI